MFKVPKICLDMLNIIGQVASGASTSLVAKMELKNFVHLAPFNRTFVLSRGLFAC